MTQELTNEDIVCFAGEDWWCHHPHSKNHLVKRLARNNRVLFINSISMGLPSMSNPDFFLKIRRRIKSYLKWLRRAQEGLWVMTPIVFPFYGSKAVRALNARLLPLQIRVAMRLCGMRRVPIIWVAIPTAMDSLKRLPCKLLLYQVSDKYDANFDSAVAIQTIRDLHEQLKEKAAVVMYSGRKLFEEARERHKYFLEQAVDFDHFAANTVEGADDMSGIPHPVLGYFGTMDYVMDLELMTEVARRHPDWHWAMIGNRSNWCRVEEANVHFLGPKPYADLPAYLRYFDVCVLPWKSNNAWVSYTSAIKVREYLASGKPVVIAPLYEFANTPGVRVFHSVDEFIEQVEDALHRDTEQDMRIRQDTVRNCTWDARAKQVGDLILMLLASKPEAAGQIRFIPGAEIKSAEQVR
jgi:glycosyltransferase involved in cell wall biosynthesis